MTDTTIPDLIAAVLPPERTIRWIQAMAEAGRQRGLAVDSETLRWLEKVVALKPHARNIGPGLDASEFYALEKLLFVATSGDASKVSRARKDLEACTKLSRKA